MDDAAASGAKKARGQVAIAFVTIVLWVVAAVVIVFGLSAMLGVLDHAGTDAAGRGLSQALGFLLLLVGGAAGGALLLARRWRVWLFIAGAIIALPAAFFGWWIGSLALSEARYREQLEELRSGQYHFGETPALLAVARAIGNNDAEAIRAAAKNVPDLQASGRDGMTLLNFAVTQSRQQAQLVSAVAALLEAGADPNFTNGEFDSYAMANSVHGSVLLLRTMLDAGGNPNGVDAQRRPIIFGNWQLPYFEADRRARFELMLDRGADLNAALPADESFQGGYTLLLYRAAAGRGDATGYADALLLLERGADPLRAAADGTTLPQLMQEHRAYYTPEREPPPAQFEQLWQALVTRGLLPAG
jgi:hypothetical protein